MFSKDCCHFLCYFVILIHTQGSLVRGAGRSCGVQPAISDINLISHTQVSVEGCVEWRVIRNQEIVRCVFRCAFAVSVSVLRILRRCCA